MVIGEDLSIIRSEKPSAKNIQAYFRSGGFCRGSYHLMGARIPHVHFLH